MTGTDNVSVLIKFLFQTLFTIFDWLSYIRFHLILGSFGLLLGGYMVVNSLYYLIRCLITYYWRSTSAEIILSDINIQTNSNNQTIALPKIIYRYQVEGKMFRNDRIMAAPFAHGMGQLAARYLEAYPKGKTTIAYYNPRKPSDAVLKRGVNSYLFIMPLCGSVVLAVGIGFIKYASF